MEIDFMSQRGLELQRLMDSANEWEKKESPDDFTPLTAFEASPPRSHPHCDGCDGTEQRLDLAYTKCGTAPSYNSTIVYFFTDSNMAQSSYAFCEGYMIYAERWLRAM